MMKRSLLIITCFFLMVGVTEILPQVGTQVPLNPNKIPQFVDPLPHFAGLRVDATAGGNMTVTMRHTKQIAVSTGTKLATGTVIKNGTIGLANLWAYEIQYGTGSAGFRPAYWPAFTIETQRGSALNVTYVNALTAPDGLSPARYSDVGLVVDQTMHWADPMMLHMNGGNLFAAYDGQPPTVVHLHGGEVPPLSDGGPDSWFTPGNILKGHAFNPNAYYYPNTQEAATLWYHDHGLGVTRLNVYAGMAGFYFLRDPNENALMLPGFSSDDLVQEVAPPGASGVFNTSPYLPEIEIAIQDRMFDTNGQLYFPNLPTNPTVHPTWTPEFVGDVITVNGKTWPYLSVAPRKYRFRILNGSNARFYTLSFPNGGPQIIQIGTDGGFLDSPVPLGTGPLLLAPGERADVIIDFTPFAKPVGYKGNWKTPTFILGNNARTPFPGGAPIMGKTTGRIMQFVVNGLIVDGTDADLVAGDNSTITTTLTTNVKLTDFAIPNTPLVPVVNKIRQLTLNEVMGLGGPLEVLVNNTKWSGLQVNTAGTIAPRIEDDFDAVPHDPDDTNPDPIHGTTYYSETMDEGTTEIWQIINLTADAHPIHLHLVQFQLMSRQPFNVAGYTAVYDAAFPTGLFQGAYGPPKSYDFYATTGNIPTAGEIYGGNPDVRPFLIGVPLPANLNERGWKDTFIMYPGEVTTVIVRWAPTNKPATDAASNLWFDFDPNGGHGYVWHCHIIDHEDNEMMRPYNVNPNPNNPSVLAKHLGENEIASVTEFSLEQNYPNPFNPTTAINFSVPNENTLVSLKIYNSIGQEVGTLINQIIPAGNHKVYFDAAGLASGVYFYTLTAGNFVESKKMVLLK